MCKAVSDLWRRWVTCLIYLKWPHVAHIFLIIGSVNIGYLYNHLQHFIDRLQRIFGTFTDLCSSWTFFSIKIAIYTLSCSIPIICNPYPEGNVCTPGAIAACRLFCRLLVFIDNMLLVNVWILFLDTTFRYSVILNKKGVCGWSCCGVYDTCVL